METIMDRVPSNQLNTNITKHNIFKPPYAQFQDFCDAFKFVGFSVPKISINAAGKKEIRDVKWSDINTTQIDPLHNAFAVKTGPISGITGIDCDSIAGYNKLITDFPELLSSLIIKTKKGFHIYCKYSDRLPNSVETFKNYPNIDVRNVGGLLFAPPSSYILNNEIFTYEIFNYAEPVPVPEKLILDVKTTKLNRKKVPKIRENLKFSQDNPNISVQNLYKKLLDELDPCYYDDTLLWVNVGAALHWSCDCKAFFQLWVDFSKKSKLWNESLPKLKNRWNDFDSTVANAKTTGTLKFYHQQSKNPHKTFINYNQLNLPKPFNIQKNIDLISNININKVNRQFVWNEHNPSRNVLPQSNRILALGFDTGQGKTHATKKYREALNDIPIFIPTPRRVVASQSAEYFDITYYEDTSEHGLNEAIQIDSLHKVDLLKFHKHDFMLFLDEFDQIAEHFLAQLPGMNTHRLLNLHKLKKLINCAKYVVIADANLTARCLKFLRSLTDKPVDMFLNQYFVERPQVVNIFDTLDHNRNNLVRVLNANQKVYCCSDRLELFEKHIIAPIREMFPHKSCIVHSSEDAHPDILQDVSTYWLNIDMIFVTPAIISGIDFNPKVNNVPISTHSVFAFYFGGGLDALKMNQQINRVRNPIEINIWCADTNKQNQFTDNHIHQNINKLLQCTKANKLITDTSLNSLSPVIEQLHADSQFINQYLSSHIEFHIRYLLEKKGYTTIAEIVDDSDSLVPTQYLSTEFYEEYRKTKVMSMQVEYNTLLEMFPYLTLIQIDSILAVHKLFVTANRFYQFEIQHKLLSKHNDVLSAAYSLINQLKLCKKLTKYLHLNWLDFDLYRDIDVDPFVVVPDALISEIYGVFQINFKPAKVLTPNKIKSHTFAQLYQLLMRMIQHVYPGFIFNVRTDLNQITIKHYKKKSVLRFNNPYFQICDFDIKNNDF